MSLLVPRTIEEMILEHLGSGALGTGELQESIYRRRRGAMTKQAFYAALRKLKAEEAVVIYQSMVALNIAWVKQMRLYVDGVSQAYLPTNDSPTFISLAEKESVSYVFSNTRHLDTFWGHTQSLLVEQTPLIEPVYSYDPHYWFYIAREATERRLVADIAESGRQFLMTVGGTTPLDAALRTEFTDDYRQYYMGRQFEKPNYYVVIVGDYITEVLLDPAVSREVDRVYDAAQGLDETTRKTLGRLLLIKARHKLKISRSARKARLLKSKLGKNFYVKK